MEIIWEAEAERVERHARLLAEREAAVQALCLEVAERDDGLLRWQSVLEGRAPAERCPLNTAPAQVVPQIMHFVRA